MAPEGESDPGALPQPEPAPGPPPLSQAALWGEVAAVLAIGVVPYLWSAITTAVERPHPGPYWMMGIRLCCNSACVSFPVLYLISRSGEPWSSFGLARPRQSAFWMGLVLFVAAWRFDEVILSLLPPDPVSRQTFFPLPRRALDYVLMVVGHAANGFAEELVTRAYLITRLERLLKSAPRAVVLSAFLFASYHLYYGPGATLVSILLFGLLFGGFYLLVRRVWPLALGHMLFNVYSEFLEAAG
jgi:membrane protease YdiL (CAAX protease family)